MVGSLPAPSSRRGRDARPARQRLNAGRYVVYESRDSLEFAEVSVLNPSA